MKKKKNEGFKTKKENRGKRFQALQVYILLLDKWVRLDSNEICLSTVSTINTANTVNTVNKVWSPLFEYETKSEEHSIEKVWSHLFKEEKIFTENKEKFWRSHGKVWSPLLVEVKTCIRIKEFWRTHNRESVITSLWRWEGCHPSEDSQCTHPKFQKGCYKIQSFWFCVSFTNSSIQPYAKLKLHQ